MVMRVFVCVILCASCAFGQGSFWRMYAAANQGGAQEFWTPADLPAGTLWFDASTSEQMNLTTNSTLGWTDRYSGLLSSNITAAARPTYTADGITEGKGSLYFDGNDFLPFVTPTNLLATSAKTLMFVAKGGRASGNQFALSSRQTYGGVDNNSRGYIWWVYNSDALYAHAGGAIAQSTIFKAANNEVYFGGFTKTAGAGLNTTAMYKNGTNTVLTTNGILSESPEIANGYTGIGKQSTDFMMGWVGEIVLTPSVLSASDRQRVEGYLAHKWGLTANLPSDHPYKNSPPYK